MERIGIFYGSTTGNTERAAQRIQKELGEENSILYNIADSTPKDLSAYDVLILGTSTWGYGDLQDDWLMFDIDAIDFTGKTVALFGMGDQESYSDTFVDGMGILCKKVMAGGGKVVGSVSSKTYTNTDSEALVDDMFVGLPLDDDNQSDLTDERIAGWVKQLRNLM